MRVLVFLGLPTGRFWTACGAVLSGCITLEATAAPSFWFFANCCAGRWGSPEVEEAAVLSPRDCSMEASCTGCDTGYEGSVNDRLPLRSKKTECIGCGSSSSSVIAVANLVDEMISSTFSSQGDCRLIGEFNSVRSGGPGEEGIDSTEQ